MFFCFFINDNDNRCIFDVFGWESNLILSNVFVKCVRQLNTFLFFILLSFFMISRTSQGEMVFGVVPGKNVESQIEWFVFIILVSS